MSYEFSMKTRDWNPELFVLMLRPSLPSSHCRFTLLGDTMNMASRMESSSQPGRIQCTKVGQMQAAITTRTPHRGPCTGSDRGQCAIERKSEAQHPRPSAFERASAFARVRTILFWGNRARKRGVRNLARTPSVLLFLRASVPLSLPYSLAHPPPFTVYLSFLTRLAGLHPPHLSSSSSPFVCTVFKSKS